MLPFSFEQCFDTSTMLLVEGSSETALFRQISSHVFRSPQVQKCISYEGHLILETFKIKFTFQKSKKKNYKIFFVSNIVASKKLSYHSERLFQSKLVPQGSINMVKVLSFSSEQCFYPFSMIPVKRSTETGFFRHLSNNVFPSP